MTLWLVDLGNSRIKWAAFNHGHRNPMQSLAHQGELSPLLDQYWHTDHPPNRLLVCSVLSEQVNNQLRDWVRQQWRIEAEFVTSQHHQLGVKNGYTQPQRLGNDRWVALVAANVLVDGPVAVVDCGTAVTIDLLDAMGQHHGGWILPGVRMMAASLQQGTAITPFAVQESRSGPAQETAQAIANGALLAVAGAIEYIQLRQPPAEPMRQLLLTGGDASAVSAMLRIPHQVESELIMHGLQLIAES